MMMDLFHFLLWILDEHPLKYVQKTFLSFSIFHDFKENRSFHFPYDRTKAPICGLGANTQTSIRLSNFQWETSFFRIRCLREPSSRLLIPLRSNYKILRDGAFAIRCPLPTIAKTSQKLSVWYPYEIFYRSFYRKVAPTGTQMMTKFV